MRFSYSRWSLLVVALATSLSACSGDEQAEGASTTSSVPVFPAAQQSFFALNKACDQAYEAGENEIQKSMAFNGCNAQRSQFAKQSQISGWVGEIAEISTDQGADVVSVDINAVVDGFDITFMTAPNRIADGRVKTLITQGEPLFDVLAQMKEGDKVNFDAEFVSHPEASRGIWENSLTEGGSMSGPAFTVRFTDIRPFGSAPAAAAAVAKHPAVVSDQGTEVAANANSSPARVVDDQYCANIYRNSTTADFSDEDVAKYEAECPGYDLPIGWVIASERQAFRDEQEEVKPSFECAKASTRSEQLICSDSELARLDSSLAAIYASARARATDKVALKNAQNQWRKSTRDGCTDVPCMQNAYEERIEHLESL